jgi:hypothetical protein
MVARRGDEGGGLAPAALVPRYRGRQRFEARRLERDPPDREAPEREPRPVREEAARVRDALAREARRLPPLRPISE